MAREQFSTRLGFLLIAAGCAIGLGNVWRFPYITGQYGGAIFVIIYLCFLFFVGVPLLTMELSVGRASRRSLGQSFEILVEHTSPLSTAPARYAQDARRRASKATAETSRP